MNEIIRFISSAIYQYLEKDFLISYTIKVTVFLVVIYLLYLVFRKYGTKLNYQLWKIAFMVILLLPVIPTLQGWMEIGIYHQTSSALVLPTPQDKVASTLLQNNPTTPEVAYQKTISIIYPSLGVMDWLIVIWMIGVIVLIAFLVKEAIGIWLLIRGKSKNFTVHLQLLDKLQTQLKLRRSVNLIYSRRISLPQTVGFISPVILLPEEAVAWSKQKIEIVLLHELTHIKSNDYLTNLLATMGAILSWYNPLVWFSLRFQKLLCEKACDEKVLGNDISPNTYAKTLLEFADANMKNNNHRLHPEFSFLGNKDLKLRIHSIVRPQAIKNRLSHPRAYLLTVLMICSSFTLATVDLNKFSPGKSLSPEDFFVLNNMHLLTISERKSLALKLHKIDNPFIIKPIAFQLQEEKNAFVKANLIKAASSFGSNQYFYQIARHYNSDQREVRLALLLYMQSISCFPSYLIVEAAQYDEDPEIAASAKLLLPAFDPQKLKSSIQNFAAKFLEENNKRQIIAKQLKNINHYKVIDQMIKTLNNSDASAAKKLGNKMEDIAASQNFAHLKHIILNH